MGALDSWISSVQTQVEKAMTELELAGMSIYGFNKPTVEDKPVLPDMDWSGLTLTATVPQAYTSEPIEFTDPPKYEDNINLPEKLANLDDSFEVTASSEGLVPYTVNPPNTDAIDDYLEWEATATTEGFSPVDPSTLPYSTPENEIKGFTQDATITAFEKKSYDGKLDDPSVLGYVDNITLHASTDGLDMTLPEYIPYEVLLPDLGDLDEIVFDDSLAQLEKHNTYVWSSPTATHLLEELNSVLNTGGFGVSALMQSAIFNTDRERKLQTLDDSLLRINAGFGARGFRVPSHLLTGPRNEVIQKYQFDLENQSREVVKIMEEHYRQNVLAALDAGIKMEQIEMDFTNKYDQLFIALYELCIKKYTSFVDAEVAKFGAKAKQAEVEIARAEIRLKEYELSLEAKKIQFEKVRLDIAVDELMIKLNEFYVTTRLENRKVDISGLSDYHDMMTKYTDYYNKLDALRLEVKEKSTETSVKVAGQQLERGRFFLESKAQEIEKIKLDVSVDDMKLREVQIKTNAYVQKVQAEIEIEKLWLESKQAEIEKIKADIAVDEIKLKEFSAMVNGYVEANRGDIESQRMTIEAIVKGNEVLRDERMLDIEVKKANIDILEADIENMKAKLEKAVSISTAWIERYKTNMQHEGNYLSALAHHDAAEFSREGQIYQAMGELGGRLAVGLNAAQAEITTISG